MADLRLALETTLKGIDDAISRHFPDFSVEKSQYLPDCWVSFQLRSLVYSDMEARLLLALVSSPSTKADVCKDFGIEIIGSRPKGFQTLLAVHTSRIKSVLRLAEKRECQVVFKDLFAKGEEQCDYPSKRAKVDDNEWLHDERPFQFENYETKKSAKYDKWSKWLGSAYEHIQLLSQRNGVLEEDVSKYHDTFGPIGRRLTRSSNSNASNVSATIRKQY